MILAVTSFIPIPGHPRPAEEYERLGEKLFHADVPLLRLVGELEQCWLWQYLRQHYGPDEITHSASDNPKKNTIAYHCVQAQKSELLALVAMRHPHVDVLVWIDFGIFHLQGVTAKIIQDFMLRAADEQAIAIPGCWKRSYEYNDQHPCWRFCGGVVVMPRKYAGVFDAAVKGEYKRHIRETGNVSWEVNCWARVEERYPELPIWQYHADHDATMFTNFRATEYADGHQAVRRFEARPG